MIVDTLVNAIQIAVKEVFPGIEVPAFSVTHPADEQFGDYSSNIALLLTRELNLTATEVAETIAKAISANTVVEQVTVAKPGFINFVLAKSYLLEELNNIIKLGDDYGRGATKAEKILFEFGQPNTHKTPHIGHLFSYCYGEACVRLLEANGYKVWRANYQGDIGPHVAKCLWAYQKRINPSAAGQRLKIKSLPLHDKVQFLQECYQEGARAYYDEPAAKHEIDQLNQKIYQKDPAIRSVWQETRSWCVEYYKKFEARLGIHYDKYYFESETSDIGKQIVVNREDIFVESDGAIVWRGKQYGLHTRVFINQFGNPTYEAKDVGLAALKLNDFPFDQSIYTTASEQNEYWKVLIKVIELLMPEIEGKISHIGFGLIQLATGKMSSRTGNIVTAFSLVEMAKQKIRDYISEHRNYSQVEKEKIAEIVAIGAIKYSFLKSTPKKDITFDLESSISFDGNSGPYLQYTFARTQSILTKSGAASSKFTIEQCDDINKEELSVLRWIYRFPEVVEEAAKGYAPHVLCSFLFELARRYSTFYNEHQILDSSNSKPLRLALTRATGDMLKEGLELLGIDVLEKI